MDACRSDVMVLEGGGGKCVTIPIADWNGCREHFLRTEPVDESQIDFTVNDELILNMTGDGDVASAKMQTLKQESKPVPLVVFAVRMSEAGNSTERRILLEAVLKLVAPKRKQPVPPSAHFAKKLPHYMSFPQQQHWELAEPCMLNIPNLFPGCTMYLGSQFLRCVYTHGYDPKNAVILATTSYDEPAADGVGGECIIRASALVGLNIFSRPLFYWIL